MIAIAKTDSFYFSSMILNAMQLMGSCDFEKQYPRSQRHCTYRGVVITIAARFSKVKSVIFLCQDYDPGLVIAIAGGIVLTAKR